jgi:23S rRNA (uracil1939-C5)-methyltransferase
MAETVDVKLFAMAHGGDALGRHEGKVIFVPYAIPGELVRAEIVEDSKRYAHARLVEVLEPSEARVEPPCPYFGPQRCGGCQWQHIAYPVQARIKGLVVVDQLQRIGKFEEPPVLEPLPDDSGWEYRNHSLFHTTPEGHPGFLAANSHRVVPVKDCLIAHSLIRDLYTSLDMEQPDIEKMELRGGTATGDLMIVLQTYDEEPPTLEVDFPVSIVQVRHDTVATPLIGLDYITEIIRGQEFRISATSFYQVNSAQAGQLVDLVLEALELKGHEKVLDAYCGMGLFTAFLAEEADFVAGIELNPAAVADARHNLATAENVQIHNGFVEELLPELEVDFDAVVIDPPRGGIEVEALDALVEQAPERIAYVSCDPATLARDARRLVRDGYHLEWVQPVDLFPQTYHIENVALFVR